MVVLSGCRHLEAARGCLELPPQMFGAARGYLELLAGAQTLFQYLFLTDAFCPQGSTDPNILVLRCPAEAPSE